MTGKSTRQVGPTNYISFTVDTSYSLDFNASLGLPFLTYISSVIVDWGDGTVEEIIPTITVDLLHTYTSYRTYTVKVYSSELYKIVSISFYSQNLIDYNFRAAYNTEGWSANYSKLTTLDISYLPNLTTITFYNNNITSVSNLTNNPKLSFFLLANNPLSSTSVIDNIFIQLDQTNALVDYYVPSAGSQVGILGTGTVAPTAASLSARNNLTAKGWDVFTN